MTDRVEPNLTEKGCDNFAKLFDVGAFHTFDSGEEYQAIGQLAEWLGLLACLAELRGDPWAIEAAAELHLLAGGLRKSVPGSALRGD